ncbi:hypothetical protein D3C80_1066320 [compost metagenome]
MGRAADAVQLRSPRRCGPGGDRGYQLAATQCGADGRRRSVAAGGVQPGRASEPAPGTAERRVGLVRGKCHDPAHPECNELGADCRCHDSEQRWQDPDQPRRRACRPGADASGAIARQFAVIPGHACRSPHALVAGGATPAAGQQRRRNRPEPGGVGDIVDEQAGRGPEHLARTLRCAGR